MGHWEWDIKKNDILWSESLFKIFDITPRTSGLTFETYLDFVHPEDRAFTENIIKTAAEKREFPDFYHRIITPKGKVKTIQGRGEIITAPDHSVVKMIGTAQDVTEEKRTEQELLVKSNELAATNNELQKFAYVASHDLQEPLRKIKTFSAILQTDYKDAIDDKGNEYMGKIINASERMQQLINDVLSFSQLNIPVPGFKPTELETVLRDVVGDLEVAIENTKTVIEHTPLPVIDANNSQMGQLFQNLISNAIKFKQPGMAPHISITANIIWAEQSAYLAAPHHRYKFANLGTRFWQTEKFLRLIFKDNGIGFEPQFAERIFSLFQRLNPREAFQGTGIGLSICKKIVENHHGIIYAESEPGKGASFIVILPVSQSNFEGGE
jgi:PAS domain S-box-containing protein